MDDIIAMYLNHISYYFAIYFFIEVCIGINLILLIHFSKIKKYAYALFGLIQNIILSIVLVVFSICNVVLLDQWVNVDKYGLKFSYGDIYVLFILIAVLATLIGGILLIVSFVRYRYKK